MKKYLIINADDFGMCMSANEAVESLFLNGRLRCSCTSRIFNRGASHDDKRVGHI